MADMVNLLEEVVLLAYRDDNGRNNAPYLEFSLAGAVLLELNLRGRISADRHAWVVVDSAEPTGDAVLDQALERLARNKSGQLASVLTTMLSGTGLRKRVLEGLVEQNILAYDKDRVLGFIPVDRYLPAEGRIEDEIRGRLDKALTHGVGVEPRTAALAGLIVVTMMQRVALPGHRYSEVTSAFRELPRQFGEISPFVDGVELAITTIRSSGNPTVST